MGLWLKTNTKSHLLSYPEVQMRVKNISFAHQDSQLLEGNKFETKTSEKKKMKQDR